MSIFVPDDFYRLADRPNKSDDGTLRSQLALGKLDAFYIVKDGTMMPIFKEQWISEDGEAMFECGYWGEGFYRYANGWAPKHQTYDRHPIVLRKSIGSKDSGSTSKSGRPVEYDWEVMLIEMARITFNENLPATQAAMVRRIQEWYSRRPQSLKQEPGDSALKKRVSLFYKAIRSETEDW